MTVFVNATRPLQRDAALVTLDWAAHWAARLWSPVGRRIQRERAARTLMALDDRQLRDMGIVRADIPEIARRVVAVPPAEDPAPTRTAGSAAAAYSFHRVHYG